MRKVLITIGHLEAGGAELRLLHLLRAVRERRSAVQVTLYVVSGRQGRLEPDFRATGVEIVLGRTGPAGLAQIYRLCRAGRFDVLHVNASLAGGFYCLAGYLAGVRVRIAHIRTMAYDATGPLMSVRNAVYSLFLNAFSTKVVGVADGLRAFARTPAGKWTTIYNGIDTEPFAEDATAPKGLQILMLGRVSEPKNPLRALSILGAVIAQYPGEAAHLHVVGRPEEGMAALIEAEIARRGLANAVTLHGASSEPFRWLRASSVLLLTSVREGLPGVVLEALSCGAPVVASRLPGVTEIARSTEGVSVVGLDEPDAVWARALVEAPRRFKRVAVARAFLDSPFLFEAYLKAILALWGVEAPAAPKKTPARRRRTTTVRSPAR